MSTVAVLLCDRAGLDPGVVTAAHVVTVGDLCDRPAAAGAALQELGARRVVLGLCGPAASTDLSLALRRAGAEPFGIEVVALAGVAAPDAGRALAGAVARLEALAPGTRGRRVFTRGRVSRRALLAPARRGLHAPVAVLDEGACLGVAACGVCAGRCPERAVDVSGRLPVIDPAVCTACGSCVTGCPAGALGIAGAAIEQLEAQLDTLLRAGTRDVVIACPEGIEDTQPGRTILGVPSLGLVTAGWLLQLRARGARVTLADCDHAACRPGHAAADVAAAIAHDAVTGSAEGARRPPPVHLREPRATAEALIALHAGAEPPQARLDAQVPLGLVDLVGDRCTLCGACATACPTGALTLVQDGVASALRLDPALCSGCGRCAITCPEAALDVRRGIDVGRLLGGQVDLMVGETDGCAMCGAALPPPAIRHRVAALLGRPNDDMCASCANLPGTTSGASGR